MLPAGPDQGGMHTCQLKGQLSREPAIYRLNVLSVLCDPQPHFAWRLGRTRVLCEHDGNSVSERGQDIRGGIYARPEHGLEV